MKKKLITIIAIVCMLSLAATSVYADSASKRRRHQLEGFLVGSTAAFIGASIINSLNNKKSGAYNNNNKQRYQREQYYSDRYRYQEPDGHWEVERIWVEPEYEEKWNPGHYNKRGRWVRGRYQRFITKRGYYKKRRVWVCRY